MRKISRISRRRLLAHAVSAAVPFTFLYTQARAQVVSWTNSAGGTFNVGSNWAGGSAPGTAATARFGLNSTYGVEFTDNPSNFAVSLTAGNVTFTGSIFNTYSLSSGVSVSGGTLTLNGPAIDASGLLVVNGNGTLNNIDSNATAGAMSVGSGSAGTLLLSAGLTLGNTASFNSVGAANGAGTIVVDNSSLIVVGQLGIGASSSGTNTAGRISLVNGGFLGLQGNLNIGTGGLAGQSGILELDDGTSAFYQNSPANITVGTTANSAGTISIGGTSTSFSTGTGLFAVNPTGFVNIAANGQLFANGNLTVKGGLVSGLNALISTGSHTFTVQDSGSVSIATNYTLGSGGTLSVANGGSFTAGSLVIGNAGTGVATISGAGSRLRLNGGSTIGMGGDGTMVISGGAVGTINLMIMARNGNSATLIVNGGSINSTGALDIATQGLGFPGTALVQIISGSFSQTGPVITAVGSSAPMMGTLAIGSGGSYISGTGSTSINSTGVLDVSGNGQFIGNASLVVNGGKIQLTGTAQVSSTDRLRVINNGSITHNGLKLLTAGTLELSSGGRIFVGAGGGRIVSVTNLSIDTSTSQLDLADNTMIIDDPTHTPATSVRALLKTGYSNGLWNGNGIASFKAAVSPGGSEAAKTALGYGLSSIILGPSGGTFAGQSVDGSAVIVDYTYAGDSNLDGQVDLIDLTNLAQHWNTGGNLWTDGDFDYDGFVNVADLFLLARDWQAGVGSPLGPELGPMLTSLGLPEVALPEPVSLTCLAGALAWSLKRPRRSHRTVR